MQQLYASQDEQMAFEYKRQYHSLKKKYGLLVFENEYYQEEVRNLQRKLLKLSRDNNFLLDRLLQHEKVSDSSDADSDATLPSDDEATSTAVLNSAVAGNRAKGRSSSASSQSLKMPRRRPSTTSNSSVSGIQRKRAPKVKIPAMLAGSSSQSMDSNSVQDIQVCLQKLSPELIQQYRMVVPAVDTATSNAEENAVISTVATGYAQPKQTPTAADVQMHLQAQSTLEPEAVSTDHFPSPGTG